MAADPLLGGIAAAPPVLIEVPDLPAELDAGEWAQLGVRISCPAERSQPVLLRQLRCSCPDAELICDLFVRDTELQPSESYWARLAVRVLRPGTFSLRNLEVQVDGDLYPLGEQIIPVRPSLRQEVAVHLEPICTYEEGTKVLLRLAHSGSTPLEDVRLQLEPVSAVRAGKTRVWRKSFLPRVREQLEVEAVAAPGELRVRMEALAGGRPAAAEWEVAVPAEVPRPPERRYRLLEPRGFSRDAVTVFLLDADGRAAEVARSEGIYPVRGRERYRIVIHPDAGRAVSAVRLRELPGEVHVNQSATQALPGRWEFEVFVSSHAVFSRRARLFYDMDTASGPLTGEIHLAVQPPSSSHLKLAVTVGAAATVQSAGILAGALLGKDPDWLQTLARFNPLQGGVQIWFLTSIPIAWASLRLLDWLQYRWKS